MALDYGMSNFFISCFYLRCLLGFCLDIIKSPLDFGKSGPQTTCWAVSRCLLGFCLEINMSPLDYGKSGL